MTSELRWRVLTLQIVLVVTLAFVSGFLYWAANFTHSFVHDELAAQKITFPAATSPAIKALPAADAQAMTQYAGQLLDDGPKAETYANHFIAVHLSEVAGGKTYAQVSTLALASPSNQILAAQEQTLFRGETLRGLLLNAWGWWTVGSYALYAAIGLTVATIAVLLALLFELFVAPGRVASTGRQRAVPSDGVAKA
jgi:hypothetical protein